MHKSRPADDGRNGSIAEYKRLLRDYLALRPSGTRQRIANVLGTHKSFISQVANPTYRVPLPAQHVETIMAVCHFSAEERAAFTAAYDDAHPNQRSTRPASPEVTAAGLWIDLSAIRDPDRRRQVETAVRRMAGELIALAEDH